MAMEPSVNNSIAGLHRKAPGSVGDLMDFHVIKEDRENGLYTLCCKTEPWMRNALGTLHGGDEEHALKSVGGDFLSHDHGHILGGDALVQLVDHSGQLHGVAFLAAGVAALAAASHQSQHHSGAQEQSHKLLHVAFLLN